MAEITILPSAVGQQANTAVLPESDILNSYLRAQELEFRKRLAQRQQDQEEIRNRINAFDINTSGSWEVDMPQINEEIGGLVDFAKQYPEALSPTIDNLDKYLEFQKRKNDILFKANSSKVAKQQYLEALKLRQNKANEYDTPEFDAAVEGYKNAGLGRGDLQLPPPTPKANVELLAKQYEALIKTGKKVSGVSYKNQFGQIVNESTETEQLNLDLLPEKAQATYDTDPAWKRVADGLYAQATPDEQQTKYGNNPANVIVHLVAPSINAEATEKQRFFTDWQAQFAQREELQKPKDSWLVDLGVELNNPNSARYKDVNFGGERVKFADISANNLTLNGKDIAGFIYKDGQTFAVPAKWRDTDGKSVNTVFFDRAKGDYVAVTPKGNPNSILIPVEQGEWFTKIMQPYATDAYGKSQVYNIIQDWQNYSQGAFPEAFDILGIPKPQGGGQTTPSTTTEDDPLGILK